MEDIKICLYENREEGTYCLPVVYPPLIKCYLPVSIMSNIAAANMGNPTWIMHNFVQLFKYKDLNKVETFPTQQFMYTNQANFNWKEITNEIFDKERIDVVQDIINFINRKQYVIIYLDEYKIPGTRNYNKRSIVHSQFVFGYNIPNKIFKVMNFSNITGQIEIIDVSFSDIENNFYSPELRNLYEENKFTYIKNKGYQIYVVSYCNNVRIIDDKIDTSVHVNVLMEQIRQYLYSLDSSMYTAYFSGNLSGIWGMNVYSEIEDIFRSYKHALDFRIVFLLYEHKFFMQHRIRYIDEQIAEEYIQIVDIAELLKNVCIKYIIQRKEKLLDRMISILQEMQEKERIILEKLFKKMN